MIPHCLFEIAKILYKKDYNNSRLIDLKTKFNLCARKKHHILETLFYFQEDLKAQEILFSLINMKLQKWHKIIKEKSDYKEYIKNLQKLDLSNLNKIFGRLIEISDYLELNLPEYYTINHSFSWYTLEGLFNQNRNVIIFQCSFRLCDHISFTTSTNLANNQINENVFLYNKSSNKDILEVINEYINLSKFYNIKTIIKDSNLPENVKDYIINNISYPFFYKEKIDYNPNHLTKDDVKDFTDGNRYLEEKLVVNKLNKIKQLFKNKNLGISDFEYNESDIYGEFVLKFLTNYPGG